MTTPHPLPTCTNPTCQGHLGKFDSCLAETLYTLDLYSGANEATGSTEAYGHYSLMLFAEDAKIEKDPALDYPLDTIPRGFYILIANDQGAVGLATYATEAEARKDFDAANEEYCAWLDAEDDPA